VCKFFNDFLPKCCCSTPIYCLSELNKGASHCGLAIYIKKYLKEKEELWKFKYFMMQKYNLKKDPLKKTKILQDIITL
jgi:hypothetical protein